MDTVNAFFRKIRSGILQMLGANAINKVVGFLCTIVLARILTEQEYGIWGFVLNIYSYFLLATGMGLESGAFQFGTEHHGVGRAYAFFKYCIVRGLLIDLLLVTVADVIFAFCILPIEGAKPYILALLPLLLLEYVMVIASHILHSQNRIAEYARALNVNTVLLGVGTCCGAFLGVQGVVAGRYFAIIISVAYELMILKPHISDIKSANRLSRKEINQLWHYSIFTGISSAMNIMVFSLDITMVATMIKDAETVAVYQFGTLIPNGLQFVSGAVVTSVLPSIIYHRNDLISTKAYLRKIYIGLAGINTFVCFLSGIFGHIIIDILSGGKYIASVPVLRILIIGTFTTGTLRTLSVNTLAAYRRVYYGLVISLTAIVADVVLNYIFITKYGMMGAAYATLCVDVLTAFMSFGYIQYLLHKGTINECY